MGVDQNYYIGPFAKCRDAGVPKTKIIRFCPSDSSHRPGSSESFCSSCGAKIVEQSHTFPGELVSSVHSWDIAEEFCERLTPILGMTEFGDSLTDYWTSNIRDSIWSVSLGMYETTIQEIAPEIITKGKKEFAEFFAPELKILRKHYASVEICWGILGWCS